MRQRLCDSEDNILAVQNNLANLYANLERVEEALSMRQEVYSGCLKLSGEEHPQTLTAANNYVHGLARLERFEEAKSLLRKVIPVARRALGENHQTTIRMRWIYAEALYSDDDATLDDVREAVTTLEDAGRIARRVLGDSYPLTERIGGELQDARAALCARETPPRSA